MCACLFPCSSSAYLFYPLGKERVLKSLTITVDSLVLLSALPVFAESLVGSMSLNHNFKISSANLCLLIEESNPCMLKVITDNTSDIFLFLFLSAFITAFFCVRYFLVFHLNFLVVSFTIFERFKKKHQCGYYS